LTLETFWQALRTATSRRGGILPNHQTDSCSCSFCAFRWSWTLRSVIVNGLIGHRERSGATLDLVLV